jgi:Uma2 family endonuclease
VSTVVESKFEQRADAGASPLVLRPDMAGTLMTTEEYDAAEVDDDDGHRYELLGGRLIVSPAPNPLERSPNEMLGHILLTYLETHEQGASMDYSLPENDVEIDENRRRADRVIWAGLGRAPDPRTDPPTIVVEFVSKGRSDRIRDYVEKRAEYLEAGAKEYWIFDRFKRCMTVVRGSDEHPEDVVVFEDDVYTTPLLPGFELPMKRLFKAVDFLERR